MRKLLNKFILTSFLAYTASQFCMAQSISQGMSQDNITTESNDLFTEKILKKSPTKRIFILSNDNGNLTKGDFFSILLNDELAARALVAKNHNEVTGIKVTKIYSMKLWSLLNRGVNIQILKGDDTFYRKNLAANNDDKEQIESPELGRIENIDDLYNDTILNDGGELEEEGKRAIKTDNIITGAWSSVSFEEAEGSEVSFPMWWISWGYQLADNFWGEVQYGQTNLPDYPYVGLDTKLSSIAFRLKYTIKAPYYSFVMPYVGYKIQSADSPDAGEASTSDDTSDPAVRSRLDKEKELIDDLNNRTVNFGVTILKRLVPGWFLKGEIGTDGYNVGIGLEF